MLLKLLLLSLEYRKTSDDVIFKKTINYLMKSGTWIQNISLIYVPAEIDQTTTKL